MQQEEEIVRDDESTIETQTDRVRDDDRDQSRATPLTERLPRIRFTGIRPETGQRNSEERIVDEFEVQVDPYTVLSTDFDYPGQVPQKFRDEVLGAVHTLARIRRVDADALLDRICIFFALHGTSEMVDPHLGFTVPVIRGPRVKFFAADVAHHLLQVAHGSTIRQVMRIFADRTRALLERYHIKPLFANKYGHEPYSTGFDFADGCTHPAISAYVSAELRKYKEMSLRK